MKEKNNEYLFIALAFLLAFFGCNNKKENFFNAAYVGKKKILLKNLQIDTLEFDNKIESSFNGIFSFEKDSIYFIDKQFSWVFVFDKDGNYKSKKLGQGKGPFELNTGFIESYVKLKKDRLFIGSGLDFHFHSNNWKRQKIKVINNRNSEINKVNPDPANISIYTLDYENLFPRVNSKNKMYLPIYSELKNFGLLSGKSYYKNTRILLELDLKKKKYTNALGRLSPEYLKYSYIPQYSFSYFDINKNNDNFFVSFEVDSLIYVYNSTFSIIKKFGNKGKALDTKYKEVNKTDSPKTLSEAYNVDRHKRGYYTHIEYFEKFDLLFRSYKKGAQSNCNGLQIYKGSTLIADIDVPKKLNWVKGYIAPYFYSNVILSDENLTLKSYRFKLPKELLKK